MSKRSAELDEYLECAGCRWFQRKRDVAVSKCAELRVELGNLRSLYESVCLRAEALERESRRRAAITGED